MSVKGYFSEGPIFFVTIRWFLAIGLIASFALALNEDYRVTAKNILAGKSSRKILSTVNGDLLNNGEQLKIIKVRLKDKLFVEIYSTPKNGIRSLFTSIQLPDSRDGYFHMGNTVTNLALKDVDNDQMLEIIAPTFDDDMKGRLNIYDYDLTSQSFEAYSGAINP